MRWHNMFGHPAPSTIDTLRLAGAVIYRTDEFGAVTVSTHGQSGVAAIAGTLPQP
jgi:competence protein ComEC